MPLLCYYPLVTDVFMTVPQKDCIANAKAWALLRAPDARPRSVFQSLLGDRGRATVGITVVAAWGEGFVYCELSQKQNAK